MKILHVISEIDARVGGPAIALILGHPEVEFQRSIRRRFSSVETIC